MKKTTLIIFSFILSILPSTTTFALSEEILDIMNSINSFYYNPEGEDCLPSGKAYFSDGSNLTIIGDSITVGATSALKAKFKNLSDSAIDAAVSRTFEQGINQLRTIKLNSIVVFALGTNSFTLTADQVNHAIQIIGTNHTIVFVTNHTTKRNYTINNQLFQKFAAEKDNILIADWAQAIQGKEKQYLTTDGIHPNTAGQELFAKLIHQTINTQNSSTSGSNQTYNGREIFSQNELQLIEQYKPIYQKAASKHNLPWQIIAVVHRREHSLKRTNPQNGQGIYQLYSYTSGGKNNHAFLPAGEVSDQEFARQTDIAAGLIRENYAKNLNLNTDNDVKTFFFRYNGPARIYHAQARSLGFSKEEAARGEGSPYVMNLADKKRDPATNPSGWGMIKRDRGSIEYPANNEPGAFLMYQALGGSSGFSSCGGSVGGNHDINQTAIDLAWPNLGHGLTPKPSYKQALQSTGINRLGDRFSMMGASCDAFVATVMRHSGVDPDFACCGVSHNGATARHVLNSGKYIEVPNHPGSLQPGDIRLSSGHIELYIEVDGVGKIASASHSERTGEILNFYDNSKTFKAYRLKR